MDQLITDRLQDNLKRLKLTQAAEILDTVVEQAESDKRSYLSFLDQLLEEEVAAKEKRRVQTAMKTAGLPVAKTIEEYDFTFHPKLNKKEVMSLFDLDFIGKQENVIFLGPPGVGKTHLAIDTREAYLFFQFVSYRYERSSTLITSNKSFGDWQELFGEQVIATAILDRLLHHCRVINIKGHSYRLRGHTFSKSDFTTAGFSGPVAENEKKELQ